MMTSQQAALHPTLAQKELGTTSTVQVQRMAVQMQAQQSARHSSMVSRLSQRQQVRKQGWLEEWREG